MAGLSLSYCQLLKIVLSQIGGSPLKQVYSQLSQGAKQITTGSGVIPNPLTEIKTVIDQVTDTINTVTGSITTAQQMMENISKQFYKNPMGTIIDSQIDAVDVRITKVTIRQQDIVNYETINGIGTATPAPPYTDIAAEKQGLTDEKSALQLYRAKLVQYKTNTDLLSGVSTLSGSEAAGGCSLQDLLGSGCTPNDAVPDIDLKNLIDSLKQGDLMAALTQKILNAVGYSDYQVALSNLNSTIQGFLTSFQNSINKAAIRNAIQAQITQIVFNLLSGCSGEVYDLTLSSNIKTAVAGYVSLVQDEAAGNIYIDPNGNVEIVTNTVTAEPVVVQENSQTNDTNPLVTTKAVTQTSVTSTALGPKENLKVEATKFGGYSAEIEVVWYDGTQETVPFIPSSLSTLYTVDAVIDYVTTETAKTDPIAWRITVKQQNETGTYIPVQTETSVLRPNLYKGNFD